MPKSIKNSSFFYGSCGTVASYYCLYPLFRSGLIDINVLLILLFIPVAVLCFAGALETINLLRNVDSQRRLFFRLIWLRLAAFAAGMSLGIGAGAQAVRYVNFGIPEASVQGVSGVLLDDPRLVSGGRAMTTLSLKMVTGSKREMATAHGDITVFFNEDNTERLREFGRGAQVHADGVLRSGTGNFSGEYMFIADSLHITQTASPLERFRTSLRLNLTQRFTEAPYGDPSWGGLSLALLLGIRDSLDTAISAMYRDSGCSHILALSGMHLAVIVALISFLLKKPLGLRLSVIIGAVIILVYCYVVGPLPSLYRAALMYLIGVIAVLGFLKKDPLLLLCMAFLVQLLITPQSGLSLSFILSYLALAGILIIGDAINGIFKGKVPPVLLASLSASLGAFLATAGVTAWFFGILRPVGIIASLILTPLTTVFMLGSIAWLLINLISPAMSPLLGYPLSLLYKIMERTASVSSNVPGIAAPPWIVIMVSLLTIAVLLYLEYRRSITVLRLEPFT